MSILQTVRLVAIYSAAATFGSAFVAVGLHDVVFATGQSWYRHAAYQGSGIALTFVGWVIMVVTFVNLANRLTTS